MKKRELNNLDLIDIDDLLADNEEALQNLKFQKAMQQLEDPLQIKSLKKETLKNIINLEKFMLLKLAKSFKLFSVFLIFLDYYLFNQIIITEMKSIMRLV